MRLGLLLCALSAAAAAAAVPASRFADEVAPGGGAALACGLPLGGALYSFSFAALELAAHPRACGRCVAVTGASGAGCAGSPIDSVLLAVADDLPGGGDALRMSPFAWRVLGAPAEVEWTFVPCGEEGRVHEAALKAMEEEAAAAPAPEAEAAEAALAPAPEAADEACVDVPPPPGEQGSFSCEEQSSWQKCSRAWMAGYCRRTCGTCAT
jgi:hypothetical protein